MRYLILLFAISACSDSPAGLYIDAETEKSEVWVCPNPESAAHGQECKRETDLIRGEYETCHWILDGSRGGKGRHVKDSFCWLLERNDCKVIEFEWQEENCHLLGERK